MMMRMLCAMMDRGGDGIVSGREFQAAHGRIFKAIDANKDGRLTLEENPGLHVGQPGDRFRGSRACCVVDLTMAKRARRLEENSWRGARTKPPLSHCRHIGTRDGAFLRGTGRDADYSTARPNNAAPADACGRVTDNIRRRCFVPTPGTAGGAHAPITCRLQRTLRGGARRWGKRDKK